jgi:hypothetical protein
MLFNKEERQESSSGLVIRVQMGKLRKQGSIPGEDEAIVSSPKYSEALKAHPIPIQCGTWDVVLRDTIAAV